MFRLLGLLHPIDDFPRIYRGLSGTKHVRATSLELLSNVLREPLRTAVLGLVDELPDAQRLQRAGSYHRPLGIDYGGVLTILLDDESGAVQDIVVFHIGELGLVTFFERVARLPNPDGARSDVSRTLAMLGRHSPALGSSPASSGRSNRRNHGPRGGPRVPRHNDVRARWRMAWASIPCLARLRGQETGAFGPRSHVVQFGHRLASGEIGLKHSGQIAVSASAAGGATLAMRAFIGLMMKKKTTRAMIRKTHA